MANPDKPASDSIDWTVTALILTCETVEAFAFAPSCCDFEKAESCSENENDLHFFLLVDKTCEDVEVIP